MQNANFNKSFVGLESIVKLINNAHKSETNIIQLCIDTEVEVNESIDALKNTANLLIDAEIFLIVSDKLISCNSDVASNIDKLKSYLLSDTFHVVLDASIKYRSEKIVLDACLLPRTYSTYPHIAYSLGVLEMPSLTRYWPINDASLTKFHEMLESKNKSDLARGKLSNVELKKKLELQAQLGLEAEEWFLEWEKNRLAGHIFNKLISRVSDRDVAAGYDLLSFKDLNSLTFDRYIEVKSFSSDPRIFISINELEVAKQYQDQYVLVILDRTRFNDGSYTPIEFINPYSLLMSSERPSWISVAPDSYRIDFHF
jgi:hypothetical protein